MVLLLRKYPNENDCCYSILNRFGFEYKTLVIGNQVYVNVIQGKITVGDRCAFEEALLKDTNVKRILWDEKTPVLLTDEQREKTVTVGRAVFGEGFHFIAGPCAVESYDALDEIAYQLREMGVGILRGGAYKPSTSPYSFHGLKEKGLDILRRVADKYSMSVVTEVMDTRDVTMVASYADVLQIGSRSMQNYPLLSEVGKCVKPVILKRGLWANYNEWLLAAEYIAVHGNEKIILCERGIRTYEQETRNTLDLQAIPVIKEKSNVPIIIDPSHAAGDSRYILPMCRAAKAAGADGLMVEVHIKPEESWKDSKQALSLSEMREILKACSDIRSVKEHTCHVS